MKNLIVKKVVIVTIYLVCSFHTSAQYKFGIHGGIGSSNFTGKDYPDSNSPKRGITAGMYFERELNMTIAIGLELNYDEKGTLYNFSPKDATNVVSDSRLHYLTFPLLIKAYLGYNAYLYFYTGASASYLLNSTNTVSATEYGYGINSDPFYQYEFRNMDAAVLLGFGVNFKELIFDLRLQQGIVDIYKGEDAPSIKNQFITATLGYSLYKKKTQYCFNPRRRVD
jgi:hypothetical protein